MDTKNDKTPDVRVRTSPVFKLKDKYKKNFQFVNLKKQFGFLPEVIIIERVHDTKNGFVIRAVLTEQEMKNEENAKAMMVKPALASK